MKKRFICLLLILSNVACSKAQTVVDITNLAGGIVTSQHGDSPAAEGIDKLIDNSVNSKYLTYNATGWVQYQAPEAYMLSSYSLTSANDASERDPKNWELAGSYSGITFYTIDTRTGEAFATRFLKKTYTINNNTTAYPYYRLQSTNNSGGITQLAELELFGVKGAMPTTPVADFATLGGSTYSNAKTTFTNASINATSYQWTFEGGSPATSTDANPVVFFADAGAHNVTLIASNGTTSTTKSINLTFKDINDWATFIYPTVTLTCDNTNNDGYTKYLSLIKQKGFNGIEDFVQSCCLTVAQKLYYGVDEANEHNLNAINYKLTEGGALSYKGGGPPTIEIGFDMNYIITFSKTHSDAASADEIYGVLCHEICHGYQREPKGAGNYDGSSEYYGFIEGLADLARLQTGGFNPARKPSAGGKWTDGYCTTAFFYLWINNTISPTFLKDLNKTALTINPWSIDAALKQLTGKSAQALWSGYQKAIPSFSVWTGIPPLTQDPIAQYVTVNSNHTEAVVCGLDQASVLKLYDMNGRMVVDVKTSETSQPIDISWFKNGIYLINITNKSGFGTLKFIK